MLVANRGVLLVAICAAIVGTSYGMHSPIVPVFAREDLLADYSQVGLIGMVNYLPYMFAPLLVGMLLDRVNKSAVLAAGISLNIFAIFMLSTSQSVPEVMLFRALAGVAHALFWPSSEVLISTNSPAASRVKGIAFFTAVWVGGFMAGPLAGKLVLDTFDYRVLFQLSAATIAAGLVPAILLRKFGRPIAQEAEPANASGNSDGGTSSSSSSSGNSSGGSGSHDGSNNSNSNRSNASPAQGRSSTVRVVVKEMAKYPAVSAVILYYAVTFGVMLAVYPAYMKSASLSDQEIELLFFVFGLARFATLFFVQAIARHGMAALAGAVALTAAGMFVSFAYSSTLSFALALVMVGVATSIFYPVTFGIVTRNAPAGTLGSRLGVYETLFGVGWAAGPIAVGLSSDAYGASMPYLAFSIIGCALAASIVAVRKRVRG